jgi:hypothetical protein
MKRFEYNLQFLSTDNVEYELRALGNQGWEVVSVVSSGQGVLKNGVKVFYYTVFLKKEIS